MNAREAITIAKREFTETFAGEGAVNVGLEEVRFDGLEDTWRITLGFSRAWDIVAKGQLAGDLGLTTRRNYKVVELSDRDGRLLAITNRDVQAAA